MVSNTSHILTTDILSARPASVEIATDRNDGAVDLGILDPENMILIINKSLQQW